MKPDNKDFINSVNLNIHTDFPYLILLPYFKCKKRRSGSSQSGVSCYALA